MIKIPKSFVKCQRNRIVLFYFVEGKQEKSEVESMTRKENQTHDSYYFQCPCCQITKCAETKGDPKQAQTTEEILDRNADDLISEDCLGKHSTRKDMDNDTLPNSSASTETTDKDLIPVQIARKPEKQNRGVEKSEEDPEYVSLNVRAKSDGRINYKKQKPNCYFGRKEEDNTKVRPKLWRRAKSAEVYRTIVKDEAGISESPVFFSSIGEWTVIDLDPDVFEKEDAKRIFYLRMKNSSYKEVEPENVCKIL